MKCSKCGEEYREGLSFCLKCGNPIDEVKDMRKIEEELSNNVGVFMDDTGKLHIQDEGIDFPEDFHIESAIVNGNSTRERQRNVIVLEDDDEFQEVAPNRNEQSKKSKQGQRQNASKNEALENKTDNRSKDRKKGKKKAGKIVATLAIILAIAAIIVAAYMLIFGNDNNKFNACYDNAVNIYETESWQAAAAEFIKADNLAKTDEQHIKAKDMLWKTYSEMDGKENETIVVLEALIGLDKDKLEYYQALIILYQNTGNDAKIEALQEQIEGTEIGDKLSEYDFSKPVASVEEGSYDEPISVELTTLENHTIYYTRNGKDPTEKSKVYKKALSFGKNGEFTLKAISVGPKGIKSEVMSVTYVINAVTQPEVSPATGEYTEYEQIVVSVPEGGKAYYTLDGALPDKNSTEYKEAIDMPIGNTIFSVIIYNSAGVASPVTQNAYNLKPYRAYTYNAALDKLKNTLIIQGLLENMDCTFKEDDSVMDISYVETALLEVESKYPDKKDMKEFYIIKTIHNLDTKMYAVSCDEGQVTGVKITEDSYELDEKVFD